MFEKAKNELGTFFDNNLPSQFCSLVSGLGSAIMALITLYFIMWNAAKAFVTFVGSIFGWSWVGMALWAFLIWKILKYFKICASKITDFLNGWLFPIMIWIAAIIMTPAQITYYVFSLHRGIITAVFAHFFVVVDMLLSDFQPYRVITNGANKFGLRCIELYPGAVGYYNSSETYVNFFDSSFEEGMN